MFLRKTHVSPLRVPPCALLKEGKERDMTRFETDVFIKVRRTCTYIYEHQ